jgi:hypothetical protein
MARCIERLGDVARLENEFLDTTVFHELSLAILGILD